MSSDLKVVGSQETSDIEPSNKNEPATSIAEQHEQDHAMGGTYHSDTISQLRMDPKAISQLFKEGKYPYTDRIPGSKYEEEKAQLQIELLKVQNWVKMTGEKIVIIFEGRDAAGKGGTIKRFMEHLNPRAAKVVALEKPTEHERGQWYFQRYVVHLPTEGEILFLDRSWYNRAGVERVMGFCDSAEYLEFMRQCPEFERMLVNSGIRLFKYYFSVTKKEQRHRFASQIRAAVRAGGCFAVNEPVIVPVVNVAVQVFVHQHPAQFFRDHGTTHSEYFAGQRFHGRVHWSGSPGCWSAPVSHACSVSRSHR